MPHPLIIIIQKACYWGLIGINERSQVHEWLLSPHSTPSEEKDILVCIITATQLSCNYTGTWLDRTSQGYPRWAPTANQQGNYHTGKWQDLPCCIAKILWECRSHKPRRTNGCFQMYYLPYFAVDKNYTDPHPSRFKMASPIILSLPVSKHLSNMECTHILVIKRP